MLFISRKYTTLELKSRKQHKKYRQIDNSQNSKQFFISNGFFIPFRTEIQP